MLAGGMIAGGWLVRRMLLSEGDVGQGMLARGRC